MRPIHLATFASAALLLLGPIAAQTKKAEAVTEERLQAAYADARKACEEVLGAKIEDLPELQIADVATIAAAITAENLPAVRLRQSDPEKAQAEAEQLGAQIGPTVLAKYSWSTKAFLVSPKTWALNAQLLRRPQMTSDTALRAVLVHELCHAIDDQKFDFTKRLLAAPTVDAVQAMNAVMEGHAQLVTRRICKVRGWDDGFEAFTGAIGAIPEAMTKQGEGVLLTLRAQAAMMSMAYHDGERFAAAVLAARPEQGVADMFTAPPTDAETILHPEWYLDPERRPTLRFELTPAIDAFVAAFDPDIWRATRNSATAAQIAVGLGGLPKADIDAVVGSLRQALVVQLVPTAAPQSKTAILVAMEFDDEASARRWIDVSARVSDLKNESMAKGVLRILESKTTPIDEPTMRGFLQEKAMKNGRFEFEVASIDAMRGSIVVETIYSGEPPATADHLQTVAALLDKVARKP